MNREDVEKIVIDEINFLIQEKSIEAKLSDSISDLELDSLDVVELLLNVEDEYEIKIEDAKVAECETINDVVDLVIVTYEEQK